MLLHLSTHNIVHVDVCDCEFVMIGGGGRHQLELCGQFERSLCVALEGHCSPPEEVGRGYDDIQMSHDKYRLHDNIIAYFTFRA